MTIKEFRISDIKEYENNPRHNDGAVDIVADDLTPEQVKAFRLADNKTGEFAEWDFDLLEQELSELSGFEFDMQQFGFEEEEIDWAGVDDLSEESYEAPQKTALKCPCCGHIDTPNHFIKVAQEQIERREAQNYTIRNATLEDVEQVKIIADSNSSEIGFVLRPALEEAVEKGHLIVAELDGEILGFCNFNIRKADGVTVIYEICTDYKYRGNKIGKALIDFLQKPISLKCPVGNESNNFYEHCGFTLKTVEDGKKRKLNVWELTE